MPPEAEVPDQPGIAGLQQQIVAYLENTTLADVLSADNGEDLR